MKKIVTIAAAAVLAFALAGCGSQASSSAASSSASASSASEAASSSAASSSAVSQTASTVKFTDVKTADEAAKGAGIDKFGVFDKITLDGKEFKDPKFAYADGVAQATYENGAIALVVRKADGKHTAPLTDRDKTSFANTWTKSYEGLDVTCYGAAKGAATVITWADGTQEFGVTYQGLGGEDVTLDSDEVAAVVKALKDANAKEQPKQETKQEEPKSEGNDSSKSGEELLDDIDPEAVIWDQGLGEVVSSTKVQLNDGNWYWEVECKGSDGSTHTYVIDQEGAVSNVDVDNGNNNGNNNTDADDDDDNVGNDASKSGEELLDDIDPEAVIWDQGLGEVVSSTKVQLNDGNWYWEVECKGSDGSTHTYVIDQEGGVGEV